MPVTLYYNPRCSKSRQALELLRSRGIEPTVIADGRAVLARPPEKLLEIL
jgi:arsenate reductase-like glutaredoxin family protein